AKIDLAVLTADDEPLPRRFTDTGTDLGIANRKLQPRLGDEVDSRRPQLLARTDLGRGLAEGPQRRGHGVATDVVQRAAAACDLEPVVAGEVAGEGEAR